MIFSSEGKEIELRGIQEKSSKVISSNSMKKLLKNGHHGVISQLFSLDVQTYISSSSSYLKIFINNHSKVFGEISKGPLLEYSPMLRVGGGWVGGELVLSTFYQY
jgi:hypothetical protein